jgi:uncharacterized SAM-binding protein YcdF (DUF218 family)
MKVNPQAPEAFIVIFGAAVRPDGKPSQTLLHGSKPQGDSASGSPGRCSSRPEAKGASERRRRAVMTRLLKEAGFSETSIMQENTGTDTMSSVRAVARLLGGQSPVYACTSAYHLPRCLMLLRLAGIAARPCPPPVAPAASSRWLRWYWRLRETPALPYDALLMLWLRVMRRI